METALIIFICIVLYLGVGIHTCRIAVSVNSTPPPPPYAKTLMVFLWPVMISLIVLVVVGKLIQLLILRINRSSTPSTREGDCS